MTRQILLLFTAVLLLSCTHLQAEIREAYSLPEVVPFVDDSTLLVVDIDNTLLEPEGSLGSDQWYYFLVRKYIQFDGMEEKAANEKAMHVWNQSQWLVRVRAVEKVTPSIIRQLQDRGIRVMGLTARTLDIINKTFAQLESAGIDLNRSPVPSNTVEFQSDDVARYEKGILFVGESNDKGKALVQFLQQSRHLPAKIVFVDDKLRHVQNVERALSMVNVRFLSFRYGAADEKVRLFNQDTQDLALYASGILTKAANERIDEAKAK